MPVNDISGYVLLSLPTNQIQPLGLLSYQRKGVVNTTDVTIKDIFIKSSQGLPIISKNHELSTSINKSVLLELSVDSHLSLLEGILKFLKLSGSFKLEKNSSLKVHLVDAKKDTVNEFKLDAYINNAIVNNLSPAFTEMLDKNELYVITDILKCKKYALEQTNQKSAEGGMKGEAPAIGELDASLHTGKSATDSSVNEGGDYITLAVKAYRIHSVKDKTGKTSYRIRMDDTIKKVKGSEKFPGEFLEAESITITK